MNKSFQTNPLQENTLLSVSSGLQITSRAIEQAIEKGEKIEFTPFFAWRNENNHKIILKRQDGSVYNATINNN